MVTKRKCNKCGVILQESKNWYTASRKKSVYWCNDCYNKYRRHWRKNNPDKARIKDRKRSISRRFERYIEKIIVYQVYSRGKMTCDMCGESDLDVLSVDHIKGGGAIHRKELNGTHIERWIIKNNFPVGYRILCRNCNWRERLKQIDSLKY